MARSIHGLPKVSPGPPCPTLLRAAGRPPPFRGWSAHRASCRLLPPWIPHAVRAWVRLRLGPTFLLLLAQIARLLGGGVVLLTPLAIFGVFRLLGDEALLAPAPHGRGRLGQRLGQRRAAGQGSYRVNEYGDFKHGLIGTGQQNNLNVPPAINNWDSEWDSDSDGDSDWDSDGLLARGVIE
jgi:hypothetical protein